MKGMVKYTMVVQKIQIGNKEINIPKVKGFTNEYIITLFIS
jgi:hypothetical protein